MLSETNAGSIADRMTIRPGRVSEIDRISDIINDPPNATALAVAGSADRAVRAGRVLVRYGVAPNLPSTVVAEVDGAVVGVMDAGVLHPGVNLAPTVILRLLPTALRIVGPGGLWRLSRSGAARARVDFPADPAAYYIAELDIDLAYRNRGIGGALLDYGEREARSAAAPRMTLVTDITNPAQHLYERHGFRIVETKRDAEYERWSRSPGRVLMVKQLDER